MTQATAGEGVMSDVKTAVATANRVAFNISLTTLEDIQKFCAVIAKSEMVPKAYRDRPDNILVAAMQGQEIGLPLFQALQSIAVINGVPSIYGDAGLALVRGSGKLEDFDEWFEFAGTRIDGVIDWKDAHDKGQNITAVCESKRVGATRTRKTYYGIKDAIAAKLWGKVSQTGVPSPWVTAPGRMMMFRARGFNLRDQFGDVLKGLKFYEEAIDMEDVGGGNFAMAPATPEKPATLGTLLKQSKEAVKAQTIDVTLAAPTPTVEETLVDILTPEEQTAPTPPPPADPTEVIDEAVPAESPTPPPAAITKAQRDEATSLIMALNATGKGRALLNGVRKAVKLQPHEVMPDDATRFTLFLDGLVMAKEKMAG